MRQISITPLPAQTFNAVLDGQYCTISLYWRQVRLYLDLSVGTNIVCRGALCLAGSDIVQSPSPFFRGQLYFYDREGNEPPHWQGLNRRWLLLYEA
jgi:hypothetical protein